MILLIKNGRLIDPVGQIDGVYDILIENEKIKKISPQPGASGTMEVIDAAGLVVSQG